MQIRYVALVALAQLACTGAFAASASNVILVTVDGLRWQEVFRGADDRLLKDERFTPKNYSGFSPHQKIGTTQARTTLMPFFWSTIASEGSFIGDRDRGSRMRVTNPWWFSYPGYNELLTGKPDPAIDSNDSKPNPNITVLEWLNGQADLEGRVQVFGSWDAFPAIINAKRSGIPVNVSAAPIVGKPTQREQWLQALQRQMPLAFPTVRHDAFTHQHALEALRSDKPRVIYIAYGEPDDFAHAGKYGEYLNATYRFDAFLKELWTFAQSDRAYAGRTVLLIGTDHGRGELPIENWQHHSSPQATRRQDPASDGYEGSEQIWFAALGAGIKSQGLIATPSELTQSQIAATVLRALGIDRNQFDASTQPELVEIFK
jgi:hypothetical protein